MISLLVIGLLCAVAYWIADVAASHTGRAPPGWLIGGLVAFIVGVLGAWVIRSGGLR